MTLMQNTLTTTVSTSSADVLQLNALSYYHCAYVQPTNTEHLTVWHLTTGKNSTNTHIKAHEPVLKDIDLQTTERERDQNEIW